MIEIFEYLRKECSEINLINSISGDKLSFQFSTVSVVVVFDDFYIYEGNDLNNSDFSVFENKSISNIYLQASTPIYKDRKSIKWSLSHTNLMIAIIRKIKHIYPEINYGEIRFIDIDSSCFVDVIEYGFQINIDEKYWINQKFYEDIINDIDNMAFDSLIPEFYIPENNLRDSFDIKILNSNTKIRRLGYLKILLEMFNEQPKITVAKIYSKFENYCQNYNKYLQLHKNQKGNVIITKTGNSAKPYIELAISLGLIHKSTGAYEIGKTGKVYRVLKLKIDFKEEFNSSVEDNPFVLSKFDVSFFLEILLKEDFWFLYTILEQAVSDSSISYSKLRTDFKKILLNKIERFIDEAQLDHSKKILPLKIIERRINDWKKPEVYMEHVLMPRLNWLFDMGLIELKSDLNFNLTEIGERLYYNLAVWNDIALHPIVAPDAYIDNYFMRVVNEMFKLEKKKFTTEMSENLLMCLEESFVLFRTLAPNRISFSLFANYTKHTLFWKYSEFRRSFNRGN